MAIERHLALQELTLRPSGEWTPPARGWLVTRVAEGVGYWLLDGAARELKTGDGFVAAGNVRFVLRASQLGSLKLQFFTVQPQFLNGVLTVAECRQLEAAASGTPQTLIFTAAEPLAQKFARLADQLHAGNLSLRCALLQLWSSSLNHFLSAPVSEADGGNKLHERFRQLVGKMTEAELVESSLSELARQLHCSERHFSRLFREEFGVPLRARQIELRLQRAQQLLADSNAKVINVAYDSGYRHLGLFNAMFKKRFGVTPSAWRQQNGIKTFSGPPRSQFSRVANGIGILMALLGVFFSLTAAAQTDNAPVETQAMSNARAALLQKMAEAEVQEKESARRLEKEKKFGPVHHVPAPTNAVPRFKVDKYLVMGNSVLPPGTIGGILTNVPEAFGTNVTFAGIQAALGDLQMAYRERGFVTVSVGLPPQKLTNAEVKVKVTEARLAAINVTGNRWFGTDNVRRALPSLHTNMLLNSHVFQRELDLANASRDRQIYPVIGPGPEPGTSALTLKVKDTFPLHARVEVNNDSTPGTPNLRVNSNAQYDNLWDLNHQIGVQYSFDFEAFKNNDHYNATPFDDPFIANYSGYYRIPIDGGRSVEQQVEDNPASFGYDEGTHKFNLPPATGQPDVTFFASRSTSDTGVQLGQLNSVYSTPIQSIVSQDSGENITLNEGLGGSFSLPLPQVAGVSSTLIFGLNFKNYQEISYNTNNFNSSFTYVNPGPQTNTINSPVHSPQPIRTSDVQYLPLNLGVNGSVPDRFGITFFNAQANVNLAVLNGYEKSFQLANGTNAAVTTLTHGGFSQVAYSAKSADHYVTVQAGATRDQTLYKEWSVRLHADGQWADTPLFSNEQYGMGGATGVRGYQSGVAYGDTGWRVTMEPRTPQVSIGMAGNEGDEVPVWLRGSVFMDYGQLYRLDSTTASSFNTASFWGVGWGLTANIGSHFDARISMAWPLLSNPEASGGSAYVYFAVGAQF